MLEGPMRSCYQFRDQSVLDHGHSVHWWFLDIYSYVQTGTTLSAQWRVPSWLNDSTRSLLASRLLPLEVLKAYQVYHDCGKPLSRVVDEEGRQHFPEHARASYNRWLEAGGDPQVAELILRDMDAHQLKAEGVPGFASTPYATTLLLTALAELHSNAQMFGGIESDSFKMKFKNLERRGKAVLAQMTENT
jgi:hypothetical protein